MKIQNLFSKSKKFIKPANESGIDTQPPWAAFLIIFSIVFLGACYLSYVVFNYITSEKTGVYVPVASKNPTVDTTKTNMVLDFFDGRMAKIQDLQNTKTVFIDPSK